ncbi:MAG TPA: hypothetical protein VN673_06220, partial [Clostridia bacterium]|nr:hypothetical protein [Clostridia bacterium]
RQENCTGRNLVSEKRRFWDKLYIGYNERCLYHAWPDWNPTHPPGYLATLRSATNDSPRYITGSTSRKQPPLFRLFPHPSTSFHIRPQIPNLDDLEPP